MSVIGKIKRFLVDESGPTSVEYAVMIMLILLACIGAVQFMGQSVGDSLSDSQQRMGAAGLGS